MLIMGTPQPVDTNFFVSYNLAYGKNYSWQYFCSNLFEKMMISNNDFYDFLEKLGSLVAETFGNDCEVAISDLNNPESSILAIFNNHVTGRNVGDPLIPQALDRIKHCADGYYINYHDTKAGKTVKTSTLHFERNGLNLAFCINYDCATLEKFHYSLSNFLAAQHEDSLNENGSYAPIIEDAMKEAIANCGKPVRLMNKKDRIQVLSYLDSRGILKMQKSIQTIAQYLGISRYSVYNYLKELDENIETGNN